MSFTECLWSVQAQCQLDVERDLTIYYKGMLSFFYLLPFVKKIKTEVSPILEAYHTVDRIEKEQDVMHPKIDVKMARSDLALEANQCVQKHPYLHLLYALQMPSLTTMESALAQGGRDYYDRWLQSRNAHIKE